MATSTSAQPAGEEPAGAGWDYSACWVPGGQLVTSLAHFYRGEVQRSNTWRNRLDTTTNWAVVTAAAALTFSFSSLENPHFVILLVILLVLVFLMIEARRYRYYELWAYRVRLMETDFYASMLVPPFCPSQEWAEALADSLLHPEFTISQWEALGRRFRRNYVWVFALLGLSWWMKIASHPTTSVSWGELLQRAEVGPVPGSVVVGIGVAFYVLLALMGFLTARLQESTSEVLAEPGGLMARLLPRRQKQAPSELRPKYAPAGRRARQQMVTIVTTQGQEIAARLISDLKRGVTKLAGQGMYSGQPRDVLLCAVAPRQVAQLKAIVRELDSRAFVVVHAAEEVAGGGFDPL